MNKNTGKGLSRFRIFLIVTTVLFFTAGIILTVSLYKAAENDNTQRRAFQELEISTQEQADILKTALEEQASGLAFLSEYFHSKEDFTSESNRQMLEAVIRSSNYNLIVFVDEKGRAYSREGVYQGNISDCDCFTDVYTGKTDSKISYVESSPLFDSPQFVFSVPVRDGSGIRGVLLCGKPLEFVADKLFENIIMSGRTSVALIDSDTRIMVSIRMESYLSEGNYYLSNGGPFLNEDDEPLDLLFKLENGEEGTFKYGTKDRQYAAFESLGLNDWYAVCMADADSLTEAYRENQNVMRKSIFLLGGAFAVILLYFLVVTILYARKFLADAAAMAARQKKEQILFENLNFDILEIDVIKDHIKFIGNNSGLMFNFSGNMQELKDYLHAHHPEADTEQMQKDYDAVLASCKTVENELLIYPKQGGERWLHLTYTPVKRSRNRVEEIFVTVWNVTQEREELARVNREAADAKHRESELSEELRSVKLQKSVNQIHPHYLYNVLGSIREIILSDPAYASDLLYDFTVHLRACVKSMQGDSLIPFEQELRNIKAYVNIEKVRLDDRLSVSYDIRISDFEIVPLGVQPFFENAIRHGITQRGEEGGYVKMTVDEADGWISILIEDTGVGFDYDKVRKDIEDGKRDSTGLMNAIYRLEKLMDAVVSVDSTPGAGTRVEVKIPKKEQGA